MVIMELAILSGVVSLIFLAWAWSIKEDKQAYKVLSISGWVFCSWAVVLGAIALFIKYIWS